MPPTDRIALRVLQAGAFAVVLAAAPYKTFDLDRFFVPKELALSITALLAALLCTARVRRLALSRVDELLALFLMLGVVSLLFATNWWLGWRAMGVSLGGAACFWAARSVARAGHARSLVAALALAGVIGAATSLLQAYGARTDFFSLNRAPGGTFGNRNFMAHLAVITLPALLLSGLRAPTRAAFGRWCGAIAIVAGALILSRSRAAWLALLIGLVALLITVLIAIRHRDDSFKLTRLAGLAVAALLGAGASLVIPNTLDWKSDSPYLETAQTIVDYKGGSGQGRLVQYGNSLRMTLRDPVLGVGPGNWPVDYPRFASKRDPSLGRDGMTSNPWPSSDWVTFISERGPVGFALLALGMLALLMDGLRGLRAGMNTEERLSSAVLISTLVVLVTVGAFDAVLLLPVAALIGWALLGALAAPSRERRVYELSTAQRAMVIAGIAVIGGAVVFRSSAQLMAMSVYATSTQRWVLERASTLDPGSYRIRVRLGQLYQRRGDCPRARRHASAAQALFPSAPAPKRTLAACR